MAGSSSMSRICLAVLVASTSLFAYQPPPTVSAERAAFDAWLDRQARSALDARRARVAALETREDIERRQRAVRAGIADMLGVLPAWNGALDATITRTTRREGYRIEHVLFESLPGFKVTALAYVPDGPGPFPAVLGTAGHADEGKASPTYQNVWVSLVRRGFIVLAYDPFGQGERIEYLDPVKGGSRVGIGTREHSMTGQQLLLSGRTLGAYMVQDMRRALDYLESRPDVDRGRLAVAGNSGGGTQAALLGAVEPRLAAVVISCYMTSWADMWTAPGPQDAEQILPGFVGRGFDFADFALAAAPRGVLVSSAIKDFFPIAGSRAASAELTPIFAALGAPDRLARVENDATHGWTQPLREGAYRALGAWLGRPGLDPAEQPVVADSEEALRVTPTGQLATSLGSRTVRAINADEVRDLDARRRPVTEAQLRTLAGVSTTAAEPRVVQRAGNPWSAAGEHLILEVEPGVRVRARLRRPANAAAAFTLLADERGATSRTELIEQLVGEGQAVLAVDVRGTGDLAPSAGASGYAGDYQFAARAWLLGTSVVAWQTRDMLQGLAVLRAEAGSQARRGLIVRAQGHTVPAALLAAQFDRPASLTLEEGLASYLDFATADTHAGLTLAVVPGVLQVTDLPELMARLAPVPVRLIRPRSPEGSPLDRTQAFSATASSVPVTVRVER
jgi:dienelactone hydrolase